MRRAAALLALVALAGCRSQAIAPAETGNPDLTADLIGKIEGCNLYRVWDRGSYVYVSICPHGDTRAQWTESCGKNCSRSVETLTPIPSREGR